MSNPRPFQLWMYRFGFIGLCIFAYFIALLPVDLTKAQWYAPDLIVALSCAWILRRPDYAPVVIVCAALLVADFLYTRPPGLWATICLLGLEFLRRRSRASRDVPFLAEWALIAALLFTQAILYRLALGIFLLPSASLGLVILQQISTLLIYPFVVLFSVVLFKVKRPSSSDADHTGHLT